MEEGRPFDPEQAKAKLAELEATIFFEKVLTNSDASGSGRIVIPKGVAEASFPTLDNQVGVELPFHDVHGNQFTVRFRFWINNASRMYLLEGTQKMLKALNLRIGNVLMFSKDAAGKFIVCGRTGTKEDMARKSVNLKIKRVNSGSGLKRTGLGNDPNRAKKLKNKGFSAHGPYSFWNGLSMPARIDGVFRALPDLSQSSPNQYPRIEPYQSYWTAIVSLGGEFYQAFFDTQEAAQAAFDASYQPIPPAVAAVAMTSIPQQAVPAASPTVPPPVVNAPTAAVAL